MSLFETLRAEQLCFCGVGTLLRAVGTRARAHCRWHTRRARLQRCACAYLQRYAAFFQAERVAGSAVLPLQRALFAQEAHSLSAHALSQRLNFVPLLEFQTLTARFAQELLQHQTDSDGQQKHADTQSLHLFRALHAVIVRTVHCNEFAVAH